jgi:hypothetical protein
MRQEDSGGRAPLPVRRAFVVRFRAEADPEVECWPGRIEHVQSGLSVEFRSLQELHSFVRRMFEQEKGIAGL